MNRRLLVPAVFAIVGAGLIAFTVWFSMGGVGTGAAQTLERAAEEAASEEPVGPLTSEALIAEALAAGDISYEESLRARAFALFDDPRLEPAFRSPVVNWSVMGALLDEITEKEATLSRELLDDLLPFRVRPNDPRSIFNRPREDVVRTQGTPGAQGAPTDPSHLPWRGEDVPNTQLRVWTQGPQTALVKYADMAERIWSAFPPYFTYPWNDLPGLDVPAATMNSREVNPNNRVDIYFIGQYEPDPRWGDCHDCAIGTNTGWTREDPFNIGDRTGSGYALINSAGSDEDVLDAMAHELAHIAQRAYDWDERRGGEGWMYESTATWVAYQVMIALGSSREWEYGLIDPAREFPRVADVRNWPALFSSLHLPLHRTGNDYSGFLFFAYASGALGPSIVKQVWQRASRAGMQGINAVAEAIDMAEHFPRFTVRNWNQEYLPVRYRDGDPTFPRPLIPDPVKLMPPDLGIHELGEDVANLAARYYRFVWSDPNARKITFESLAKDLPDAHVWAIKRLGTADWKTPEDWSRMDKVEFCRDTPQENVTELVLVASNSHLTKPLSLIAPGHPKPRVLVEDVGCEFIEGTAQSTLRLKDDRQDVTYVSSTAALRFKPRTVQDQPGNIQYDLTPTSVTWTVAGTQDDCTVQGRTVVTIPAFLDQPLDPTRPAYGYLNVVGLDGGDFHSLKVSAVNPSATYTKTCPGDPPLVTQQPFQSVWLLSVLSQMNTHTGTAVAFRGTQTFDPGRFQDNLPQAARDLLSGMAPPVPRPPLAGAPASAPPAIGIPGVALPGGALGNLPGIDAQAIDEAMRRAREALQQADLQAGKVVYTFRWDLKPMTGAPATP